MFSVCFALNNMRENIDYCSARRLIHSNLCFASMHHCICEGGRSSAVNFTSSKGRSENDLHNANFFRREGEELGLV